VTKRLENPPCRCSAGHLGASGRYVRSAIVNDFNNDPSAMPDGFRATSREDLDQIEGGSLRDTLFEMIKAVMERYDQTAKNILQSIGRG
jgi:hypothetical protein